ncbi:hypothetical protein ACFPRL_27035 [Pseudoclavibacter helvolus]
MRRGPNPDPGVNDANVMSIGQAKIFSAADGSYFGPCVMTRAPKVL